MPANMMMMEMAIDIDMDDDDKLWILEHKTCDILGAERLRLMRFDNQLIIESFQKAICILKC